MGVSTFSAGGFFQGQLQGLSGEGTITALESLDINGFSKVYNVNAQTPDSGIILIN